MSATRPEQGARYLIPPSPGALVTVEEVVTRPGSLLRGHRHTGTHVCVVLAGSFDERVSDGKMRRCWPGTLRVSAVGREHEIRFGPEGAHCLLFVMPGAAEHNPQGSVPPDVFREDGRVSALASQARAAARREGADAPLIVEELVAELIAGATRSDDEPPPTWLTEARRWMDGRFREPVSLAGLAKDAGVHRVHLARAFARFFGRPAREHLRALRLAEAARHLCTSNLPLAEIAIHSGFFDQSHLTRAFRCRFGMPPAAFRRAWRSRGRAEIGIAEQSAR